MGVKDTSWNSMKSFLAKRGFKEEIQNFAEMIQMRSFTSQQISLENVVEVEKLIKSKRDSFDLKNARRASVAAGE
jgi:dynein heavy chain 2